MTDADAVMNRVMNIGAAFVMTCFGVGLLSLAGVYVSDHIRGEPALQFKIDQLEVDKRRLNRGIIDAEVLLHKRNRSLSDLRTSLSRAEVATAKWKGEFNHCRARLKK